MADNPNIIKGDLNFSGGGAGMFAGLGGSPASAMAALGPNYANAYNSALEMNKQNYGNILTGYQQAMSRQNAGQQGIMDTISGVGQAGQQDILDRYAASSGSAAQGLIDRGLGNTTVQNSVQRGIDYDREKSQVQLADAMAQLRAGYQNRAVEQNTGLAGQQLNWMNSITSSYPNAGMYGQLAGQFGAAQQGDADRALAAQQMAAQQALARSQSEQQGQFGMQTAAGGGYLGSRGTFGNTKPYVAGQGYIPPTPTGGGFYGNASVLGGGPSMYIPPDSYVPQDSYGGGGYDAITYEATGGFDPNSAAGAYYGGYGSWDDIGWADFE